MDSARGRRGEVLREASVRPRDAIAAWGSGLGPGVGLGSARKHQVGIAAVGAPWWDTLRAYGSPVPLLSSVPVPRWREEASSVLLTPLGSCLGACRAILPASGVSRATSRRAEFTAFLAPTFSVDCVVTCARSPCLASETSYRDGD